MSRHYLDMDGTNAGKSHAIVGYDRQAGAFFCQIWLPHSCGHPAYLDNCFEIDTLNSIGAVVPPELHGILTKEALGEIDPNYVKDWRSRPVAVQL